MVKRPPKSSISEDDGEAQILNENGKRAAETPSTDGAKRIKTKSLYRQPTVRELNRLQETETLFNSNLFRLQVEEILQEVKPKDKTYTKFQKWFDAFKEHLNAIPVNDKEYDLSENTLFKELKVKSPASKQLQKTKCVFKFHKFKEIEIVGSYILGCPINSKLNVDIQITVPAETYTKNDSLNYRYHKKRAAYLAYIASHLKNLEIIEDLKYLWLHSCESKPVLNLKPNGKLGNRLGVRIHLSCEAETYKLQRFSPSRNNLREAWLCNTESIENNQNIGPPTPYYNSSVLSELTATANHEFLSGILANGENLKQAIILLKIWLRQRNLQVSGHVVSMLVAHLVQTKRINNIMSSYQIVRNVWISLKTSEWDKKGVTVNKTPELSPSLDEFLAQFPVVFLDVTGFYNICWEMQRGTYQALKRESALAVDMLDNTRINSFLALFMTPIKPLLQFDNMLKFKDLRTVIEKVYAKASKEAKLNYGLHKLALVTDSLHGLLSEGLGDRVILLQQLVEEEFSCSVKENVDKAKETSNFREQLSFGLILDPDNAHNPILKGPPANLPEAEQFRAFWGEKSELRRFQDGSITETCVWPADTTAERRLITKLIVEYLLKLKYDISDTFYVSSQLDSAVVRKGVRGSGLGSGEEEALKVIQTFDDLRRELRALTDLPLDVSSVYGTSPVFSYCSPLPPLPCPASANVWRRGNAELIKDYVRDDGLRPSVPYVEPVRAVIELGHSGKWPGDLQAFRCLKAAFHQQISERLTRQYSLPTHACPDHLDVLKSGLVFRLQIAHPKEITLLRREVHGGVVKYRDTEESLSLQYNTMVVPRLIGALHGLHQRHSSFGPAACLLARWMCAQLSPQPPPPLLAPLLTAHVYLSPAPLSSPAAPLASFLRVLRLLVEKDWAREVLMIDFGGDMSRDQISEIERKVLSSSPETALRVVTSLEVDEVYARAVDTSTLAARPLARLRALADVTLHYLDTGLHSLRDNVLTAFVPSLRGYDALVHLHPHLVPLAGERVSRPPRIIREVGEVADDVIPVVDFDPVRRYLEELRSAYSDFALFFHDAYGGEVIAVLWKPDVAETKEFQVSTANALKPSRENGKVVYRVNTDAIIQDFKLLGEGLVKDVTVNT